MSRKTILLAAAATLIAAVALLPSEASAATVTFRKSDEITIPASGAASTYPSTIGVRNMRGPVTDIQVSLNGVYHTRPRDLDVMLVGPDGTSSTFMSDACGDGDVSNRYWTFHSTGDSVGMPQDACPGADYLPTNFGFPDSFPGSGASGGDRFTDWHRKVLTGQWKLYVVDDEAGESGRIANGWSLTITTGPVDAYVPGRRGRHGRRRRSRLRRARRAARPRHSPRGTRWPDRGPDVGCMRRHSGPRAPQLQRRVPVRATERRCVLPERRHPGRLRPGRHLPGAGAPGAARDEAVGVRLHRPDRRVEAVRRRRRRRRGGRVLLVALQAEDRDEAASGRRFRPG